MSDSPEIRSTKKGVDALIERVNSRFPSSVTPSTRIEIHPSEWLELTAEVAELRRALATADVVMRREADPDEYALQFSVVRAALGEQP